MVEVGSMERLDKDKRDDIQKIGSCNEIKNDKKNIKI